MKASIKFVMAVAVTMAASASFASAPPFNPADPNSSHNAMALSALKPPCPFTAKGSFASAPAPVASDAVASTRSQSSSQ